MLIYDSSALRRLRTKRNLDPAQLAQRANLSVRTLYFLERGSTEPSASTLGKLATALAVRVDAFFCRKDEAA